MNPRRFRTSRGLTLAEMAEQLADHVGVANPSTVSKQERGRIFPTPEYIEAWRKVSDGKVQYEDWIDLRAAVGRAPELLAVQ